MGRLQNPRLGLKAFLSATATGILVFLLVDVLGIASDTVSTRRRGAPLGRLRRRTRRCSSSGRGSASSGLVGYDRWIAATPQEGGARPGRRLRGGVVARGGFIQSLTPARSLALLIATGIGLHNFAEGLAIGQSAASGETQLAVVLVVGFALHNATEGFGIVAPLAGRAARARAGRFLALLGLIGGGPTFVGTLDRPGLDERGARRRCSSRSRAARSSTSSSSSAT